MDKNVTPEVLWDVLEAIPEPILILDRNRNCVFANESFHRLFPGLTSPSEGKALRVGEFWRTIENDDLSQEELRCEWDLDGGDSYSVKLAPKVISHGHLLVRVLAGFSTRDEFSVFHSQRLETLGLLASGVAHDFNNVLTGILGHLAFLRTILPQSGKHVDSLSAIEEGARKASGLSQQILNFSKLDAHEENIQVDLNDLVARMVGLLRGSISPEYQISFDRRENSCILFGSEGRIAQVIVNLAVNARDALKPGGAVTISVSRCAEVERLKGVFATTELPCASYVVLSVKDNGHGMTQDVMDRMFEPYFSTKRGSGTGLGLSTVAAIVRELGGAIDVRSALSQGTEIEVFFPSLELTAEEQPSESVRSGGRPAKAVETEVPRGTERILVVDDEYSVRNVLALSLQHLGYDVVTAASGPEALELYESEHGRVQLVILDMLMPQLSGEKVFAKLKDLDDKVRVLLISGFASAEAVQSVLRSGGLGFIQKPFTIEELARRVRGCFDSAVST